MFFRNALFVLRSLPRPHILLAAHRHRFSTVTIMTKNPALAARYAW
jgi:hypothetical protein